MVWSVGRATWVGGLTDPEISQQVGTRTFDRGVAYRAEDRVRSLAAGQDGLILLGTVEGSRDEDYQAIVTARPHPLGRGHLWSGRCSCPVGADCKHVVALLLVGRDVARGVVTGPPVPAGAVGNGGAAVAERPVSGVPAPGVLWSDVLRLPDPGQVVTREPARSHPTDEGTAAGLIFDTIYVSRGGAGGAPQRGVGLRPSRRTRAGTWHRSLSWHEALPASGSLRGRPAYQSEHESVMTRIHQAGRTGGTGSAQFFTTVVPIRLDASAELVPLLAQARALGVELMAGEGFSGPIRIEEEPVTLVVEFDRSPDDSGDLAIHVTLAGLPEVEGEHTYLGTPVHGLLIEPDGGGLVLVPVEQSLDLDAARLEQATLGLRVPADLRGDFLRHDYPRLRRLARVRSRVPLPVVPDVDETGPDRVAVVTVHVRVSADVPGELRLGLGLAYDGRLRSFATERFGAPPRDPVAEEQAVASAASVLAIPGATRASSVGDKHLLAPYVMLKGIDAARFTLDFIPALEADEHVTLVLDDELPTYEEVTSAPLIRIGADDGADPDWFDLHVTVEVEGEEVPFEPLFAALAHGQEALLLESGSWFRLDHPELERLRTLIDEARELADPGTKALRLSAHHADFWEELVALGVVDRQSSRWATAVEALGSLEHGPVAEVPATLLAQLRPYQVEGFQWLSRLWDAQLGGILADDMGLGKTVQMIAAICRAHDLGELTAPMLVVAPTSVLGTWAGELATFAPHLSVVTIGETTGKRGTPLEQAVDGASVVITSYAVFRLDADSFQGLPWAGVVLDEAQFVKNRQAKTHVAVRKLGAPFTIAVTGTPLENSLMDLWSLLSLTAPGLYPRPDTFTHNYRKPIESGERPDLLDRLRRRIRPLMLRRTKEQVALDLPPKQIQVFPVTPHPVHARIYEQHLSRERQRMLGLLGDPEANRVAILASLTRLRQLALDPALVDEAYAGKAVAAKVQFLVEQLRELAAEGHRALVFSQFTGFLRIVERALEEAGLRTCYLDGSTRDRQEVIRGFRDGEAAAFLISLKAGGFGLTLTEADYVFVLDPWWNPAAEAQAIDRTHRIGQTRPVTVYRLVSAGTIEEKVVALQDRKRDLFQRVVDEGGSLSGAITSADVRDLLGLD
ncbi:MAG: DEAD/DEAH box helicase [Dermatophilaceae bacterium]